jgi:hypothetical protein
VRHAPINPPEATRNVLLKSFNRWNYVAVWPAAAIVVWALFVPGTLSTTTFVWLNLALIFGVVFTAVIWSGARPTRSVTQLLHDVESDPKLR